MTAGAASQSPGIRAGLFRGGRSERRLTLVGIQDLWLSLRGHRPRVELPVSVRCASSLETECITFGGARCRRFYAVLYRRNSGPEDSSSAGGVGSACCRSGVLWSLF
jgi:hypothetical protein